MIKTVNLILSVFNYNDLAVQFFYIYPRYPVRPNTHIQYLVNKLLNKHCIGDGLKKLKFKESFKFKYLNGLCKVRIYKGYSNPNLSRFVIAYDTYQVCCRECYYNLNGICEVWNSKIINGRYKCVEWRENAQGEKT